MLGKLIKYDLRYVTRYLWILAIASLGGALIGGFSIRLIEKSVSGMGGDLVALGIIGIMIAVLVLSAFALASMVFVFYRFNQNFYTDEAYLTFTLPVKKSELLISKLVSGIAVFSVSSVILFVDIFIMMAIGEGVRFFEGSITADPQNPLLSAIYFVETLVIVFASATLVTLVVFIFISLSSMLRKKHRIIIGIAIAYLISGALSMLFSFAFGYGSRGIAELLRGVDAAVQEWLSALVLLTVASLLLLLSLVAYTVEYRILDRHLNLS
jgi:hypothetical protein